jgi:hypothetical protein
VTRRGGVTNKQTVHQLSICARMCVVVCTFGASAGSERGHGHDGMTGRCCWFLDVKGYRRLRVKGEKR